MFLVGGGPSLYGFNWDLLRGHCVVAINDALLQLPEAKAVFSADIQWIESLKFPGKRRSAMERFSGEKYLAVAEDKPRDLDLEVDYLIRVRALGLSTDPGKIHVPGSSGYGALNLAFLKGCREIVLLGMDYSKPGKEWSQWASHYNIARDQLVGVVVLNASTESRITAFTKVPLNTALEMK